MGITSLSRCIQTLLAVDNSVENSVHQEKENTMASTPTRRVRGDRGTTRALPVRLAEAKLRLELLDARVQRLQLADLIRAKRLQLFKGKNP
jgi:hypothetical protein